MTMNQGEQSARSRQDEEPSTAQRSGAIEEARPLAAGVPAEYCPNCSEKLRGRQCKLVCPRCGYFLSCSDYY
jgi:hypothetical protein